MIIETVCPQLAEAIVLHCAKINQVEMKLKSLQRKMSTRKEEGRGEGKEKKKSKSQSSLRGRQAETPAEVTERLD